MSDDSLRSVPTSRAHEGDDLVCYRFHGTVAFARTADIQEEDRSDCDGHESFWSTLTDPFFPHSSRTVPTVCVPPGTRLMLMDITEDLQEAMGVGRIVEVSLTLVHENESSYDAVRFPNGCEFPVRGLRPGQRVRVLWLPPEPVVPDAHHRHE
ncbi:MAG TPA: hypothetical protein VMB03_23655 [Bryobacteraceae bacterium]|nr:hypothetical protein [Bryobacteraceae bacterium]